MSKKLIQSCMIVVFLLIFPGQVSASENSESLPIDRDANDTFMEEQLDRLGLENIRTFWEDIIHDYGQFVPDSSKTSFRDIVSGNHPFSIQDWLLSFARFFFHEILQNGMLLGTLILLAVFSTMLKALQTAFEQHVISKVAYSITFLLLITIALNSFYIAMDYTGQAVETMVHFMVALIPLMLALLASVGALTSAALFHPLIIFLVNTSGILIQYVVLPLLFLSALLSLVSLLSDDYKVTKLAELMRRVGIGILGIFLTVFLGVISVQGATASVADGITLRTAKYIAGNFVPVVGRMFTDAADTVMGASLLLKNTIGIAGLGILLLICVFPALKVLVLAFIFHLSAAVLQPLDAGPLTESLSLIGKTVLFMFAALATVSLMFFLALTIIIASGNLSLMIR